MLQYSSIFDNNTSKIKVQSIHLVISPYEAQSLDIYYLLLKHNIKRTQYIICDT